MIQNSAKFWSLVTFNNSKICLAKENRYVLIMNNGIVVEVQRSNGNNFSDMVICLILIELLKTNFLFITIYSAFMTQEHSFIKQQIRKNSS